MQYLQLIYPVIHKVSNSGSTSTNYDIKMLLHALVSDKID